jgi:hypothetical protein
MKVPGFDNATRATGMDHKWRSMFMKEGNPRIARLLRLQSDDLSRQETYVKAISKWVIDRVC